MLPTPSETGALSRRAFIGWAVAGVAVVATGAIVVAARDNEGSPDLHARRMHARSLQARIKAIGQRYRAVVPADDLEALPQFDGTADADFGALASAVKEDFQNGDVVIVDGWVLARTELRAAALFARNG